MSIDQMLLLPTSCYTGLGIQNMINYDSLFLSSKVSCVVCDMELQRLRPRLTGSKTKTLTRGQSNLAIAASNAPETRAGLSSLSSSADSKVGCVTPPSTPCDLVLHSSVTAPSPLHAQKILASVPTTPPLLWDGQDPRVTQCSTDPQECSTQTAS